jgi:glycosyl hydrolase family 64 (putative beta-1,3-glucanase)/fibronectin type III domain protein
VKVSKLLLVAGFVCAPIVCSFGQTVLTMEIVNDTETTNSQVFVLMSGTDIKGMTGPMTNAINDFAVNTNNAVVSCIPLNTLTTNGTPLVSALTGKARDVYTIQMTNASSARFFVSYSTNLHFTGATAPTNVENYRFDKMEVSYDGTTWDADLTSVDFVGIPMQIDAVSNGAVIDTRSFYLSRQTILNSIPFPSGANNAIQYTNVMGTNQFLRLLSPQTMAGTSNGASVKPYPSFRPYLSSLVPLEGANFVTTGFQAVGAQPALTWIDDNTNTIALSILQNGGNYSYQGAVVPDGKNGFIIKMQGSVNNWVSNNVSSSGPPPPIGNCSKINIKLPAGLLDNNAYGCNLNSTSFSVTPALTYPTNATTAAAQASYFNAVYGNSIYSWIVGNVQAGLNLGYVGGRWGNSTTNWFETSLPPNYPFGMARKSNDGFYNPYAAAIFNASDSYGFAFSDRAKNGINPLISYPAANANLRVTILPENQLDAPRGIKLQSAGSFTTNSIAMRWDAIKNAPSGYTVSYLIDTYPPMIGGTVTATSQKATLTNLLSGMPYTFFVKARAVSPDLLTTNTSLAIPAQLSTGGSFVMPGLPGVNKFGLNCSGWAIGVFPDASKADVSIAGTKTPYTPVGGGQFSPPAFVTSFALVDNYYPIVIKYGSGKPIVYQNVFKVRIQPDGFQTFKVSEQPTLPLVTQPLTIAPPNPPAGPPYVFPQGPFDGSAGNLVIGAAGDPQTLKQFAPVLFPSDPTPPPGARYDFDRDGVGP